MRGGRNEIRLVLVGKKRGGKESSSREGWKQRSQPARHIGMGPDLFLRERQQYLSSLWSLWQR